MPNQEAIFVFSRGRTFNSCIVYKWVEWLDIGILRVKRAPALFCSFFFWVAYFFFVIHSLSINILMLDCTSVKREWRKKKLSRGQEHKNQQHTKIDANDETKKKSGRFVSLDNTEGHKKIHANIFIFYARTQKLYWSPDKFQSGINRFSKLLLSEKMVYVKIANWRYKNGIPFVNAHFQWFLAGNQQRRSRRIEVKWEKKRKQSIANT